MELKDFVNRVVVAKKTGKRMYLIEITSPYLRTVTVEPDTTGHHTYYIWPTINGDPISEDILTFEDESLIEPFITVFKAYERTEAAYWEEYGYWMRRD